MFLLELLTALTATGIIQGESTRGFESCVAVEAHGRWQASGVLISPDVVLTSASLWRKDAKLGAKTGGITNVYVGDDVTPALGSKTFAAQKPQGDALDPKRTYAVRAAIPCPSFKRVTNNINLKNAVVPATAFVDDICVLILERPVDPNQARPAAILREPPLKVGMPVEMVGFGVSEYRDGFEPRGFGVKRKTTLPVTSLGGTEEERRKYGFSPKGDKQAVREFVVADLRGEKDGSYGDAGGGVYVQVQKGWKLAGIVSRGVLPTEKTTTPFGEGTICSRVEGYEPWIQKLITENKGQPPE